MVHRPLKFHQYTAQYYKKITSNISLLKELKKNNKKYVYIRIDFN